MTQSAMSKAETKKKPEALSDKDKIAKKFEEFVTLVTKVAQTEGKSDKHQIMNSVIASAVKSFEGGHATLDWEKVGNNTSLFARIPSPTNVDVKKILLQLIPVYLDLEIKERAKAKKENTTRS